MSEYVQLAHSSYYNPSEKLIVPQVSLGEGKCPLFSKPEQSWKQNCKFWAMVRDKTVALSSEMECSTYSVLSKNICA